MKFPRGGANWRSLTIVAALGAAALLAPALAATGGETLSVADFARRVWTSAQGGASDKALDLMARLPADSPDPAVRELRAAVEQRNQHLADADKKRTDRITEVRAELDKNVAADKLPDALKSAVELQTLARDEEKAKLLADDTIKQLTEKGEAAARTAEKAGKWLEAQELFYRLHLLYEDDGRYKPDVDRVGRRLMMLRLYTPKLLYEMRNQQRMNAGDEKLPPFNPIGEDWAAKLDGINRAMVVRALNTAQGAQVDGADMAAMLLGGIDAVKTLATTPDLAEAFPALAEVEAHQRFVDQLDDESTRVKDRFGKAGYFDLTQTLERILRTNANTVKIPEAAILHEFGAGAMDKLDEFSAIIWPDELRRFQRSTQGRFTGVGIQIQLDDALQLTVVTPLEGTPAQKAGIRKGDFIREVDGESTLGISLSQAVDRITGEQGTKVTLTIERPGVEGTMKFDIVRDVIPVYSVKGWKRTGVHETDWDWFIDPASKIGYVRLTQFSEDTTQELKQAIGSMRRSGLSGLIVDLRFNPGGLLNEAVSVANMFVDDGVIVSQHDANGVEREEQRAQPGQAVLADIPVAVLINEGSASASEIVSGCLQDYHKAVLVGARSFGKGSVQNVYPLAQGLAALKLTTQYYHLPDGRLIHRRPGKATWGVEPDVHVPMLPQQINDAITLRLDADVVPLDEHGEAIKDAKTPDPDRLIKEGIDPQLETALLLIRSQCLTKSTDRAMADKIQLIGS